MCMKNVNINSFICQNIIGEDSVPSFLGVSDVLVGSSNEKSVVVEGFSIVIFANILQASDEEVFFNNYECSLRITSFEGNTTEITRFTLNEDMKIIEKKEDVICRTFGTNKFYVTLKNFDFPDGEGQYIVKVLIRKRSSDDNMILEKDTQSMTPLYVTSDSI